MPVIAAVGTAVPPHLITQAESREIASHLFRESFSDLDRLLPVFESAQIDQRHFCVPPDWFTNPHPWEEKNALYIANAIELATAAVQNCLEKAGLSPQDIDHLVFVSTTGISTPSIDAHLFNRLGLRSDVRRTPIWGLGCAGGAAGLARGFDLAQAHPHHRIVVVALELCGLTFLHGDRSKSNLIATSLFGDGAAAVLICGDQAAAKHGLQGPHVLGSRSTIWPDTLDVMGWDVRSEGLKVIFSRDIPTIVHTKIPPEADAFFTKLGLSRAEHLSRFIAHPGGMKVLAAYQEAFSLPQEALNHARDVLRTHGNMSSCTVYFVLERELADEHQTGEHGLLLALGPGFSCEQVMLRW
ncbi:MAG: 3-oxoacyl-[acyl-carrier-protein] synthase III C-terminal domain-containing protein [Tumebacillaceae bacterium]